MPQLVIEVSEEEYDTLQDDADFYSCGTPDGYVQALVSGMLREWPIAKEAVRREWHLIRELWIGEQ